MPKYQWQLIFWEQKRFFTVKRLQDTAKGCMVISADFSVLFLKTVFFLNYFNLSEQQERKDHLDTT